MQQLPNIAYVLCLIRSFTDHTNWVRCSRWSPDGSYLVSCSDDKTVRLWSPGQPGPLHTFALSKGFGHHVEFHPSGACVGVATSANTVEIYDIRCGKKGVFQIIYNTQKIHFHCIRRARKLQQLYNAHEGPVTSMSFHPSGNFCVSGSADSKIKIYDLLQARTIFTLSGE